MFKRWIHVRRLTAENAELRAEIKRLRAETHVLRADRERISQIRFERESLLLDRVLLSNKAAPISDEAEDRVGRVENIRREQAEALEQGVKTFLNDRLEDHLKDADDAGVPYEKALADFKKLEPTILAEYEGILDFEQ